MGKSFKDSRAHGHNVSEHRKRNGNTNRKHSKGHRSTHTGSGARVDRFDESDLDEMLEPQAACDIVIDDSEEIDELLIANSFIDEVLDGKFEE